MRVGVIGPLHPDSFAQNIVDCLPEVGATAVALGPPRLARNSAHLNRLNEIASDTLVGWDLRQQRRLIEVARDQECDVIVSIASGLLPQTVDALRATSPIVHWFPDHAANLGRQLMLAGPYSRVYFTDPGLVDRVTSMTEIPAGYLPEACNPSIHRPVGEGQSNPAINLAGNMYPSRVAVLDRLHRDGIPLDLYGAGFPRWMPSRAVMDAHRGRAVTGPEKARVFREAAGVLNNLHPAEGGTNCRLFEAASCGAAVLCEYRPALDDLFDLEAEIVVFRNYRELLTGARRLLEDSSYGRTVGDAAARRALAEHTYQHRIRKILEDVA